MSFHAGQLAILRRAKRFNAVACGRRFGKTAMGLAVATVGWPGQYTGLQQGFDAGWFAPNYKLLDEAWRAARYVLGEQGAIRRVDSQQHRLELTTGAALDFWTLEDPDSGRGRRYGVVIIDEAAMARHLERAWTESIRPTLTDFAGGGWFLSTPKGWNYFRTLHQMETLGREGWASHHAPSAANPHLPPGEIEDARRNLPERVFAQEYLAKFIEDGGGVFRRVTAAVDTTLFADPHKARDVGDGRPYVIGADWGRNNDFTVLSVIDAAARKVVSVDRFTDLGYGVQLGRLQALHQRFPRASILAESNSMGGPLVEALQRMRLPVRPFYTTNASKADAIEALALAFERDEIGIPPVDWLVDEFMAYDQERLPSGSIRYGAPKGGHDDGVMSVAIAWSGVQVANRPSIHALSVPSL